MGYYRSIGVRVKKLAFQLGRKHLGQLLFSAVIFVFGILFAFTLVSGESIAVDELRTQTTIYLPGFAFAIAMLTVWLFVRAARDIDTEKQAELDVARIGLQQSQNALQSLQAELATATGQVSGWKQKFEDGRTMYGVRRIWECGHESQPKKLSVNVQFVRPDDRLLAESIRKLFVADSEEFSPWKLREIEPIIPQNNPSDYARIVLFSNDPYADGVAAAMRDFQLIREKVTKWDARPEQKADVEIVIFDHVRKRD